MIHSILHPLKRLIRYLTSGWRYKALNSLLFILTPAVIGLILWREWETLVQIDWQIKPRSLTASFLLLLLDMLLGAFIWHIIIRKLTGASKAQQNIKIWWYSNLARRIPTPVWYIASRSIMYKKQGISERDVSLASGLEFALIFASGVVVFVLTLPFWSVFEITANQSNQLWLIIPLFGLSILLMHPRLISRIWRSVASDPITTTISWKDSIQWILGYLVVWSVGGVVFYFLIDAFYPIGIQYLIPSIGMWALGSIASMLGSLFFFVGALREISIILLLSYLMPLPVAIAIGILLRLLWLLGELVTAILSIFL